MSSPPTQQSKKAADNQSMIWFWVIIVVVIIIFSQFGKIMQLIPEDLQNIGFYVLIGIILLIIWGVPSLVSIIQKKRSVAKSGEKIQRFQQRTQQTLVTPTIRPMDAERYPAVQKIEVISPNKDSVLRSGDLLKCEWMSEGIQGNVQITLYQDNSKMVNYEYSSVSIKESIQFALGNNVRGRKFKIKITSEIDPKVQVFSEEFRIRPNLTFLKTILSIAIAILGVIPQVTQIFS